MTFQGHTLSVIWKALTMGHSRTFFSNWQAYCLRAQFQIWLVSTFYYKLSFALQILLHILYSSVCEHEISASSSLKSVLTSWSFYTVNKIVTRSLFLKAIMRKLYGVFHLGLMEIATPFTKLYAYKGTDITKTGHSLHNVFQWCADTNYNIF